MAGLGFKLGSLASSGIQEIPVSSTFLELNSELLKENGLAKKNSIRSQGRLRPAGAAEHPLEEIGILKIRRLFSQMKGYTIPRPIANLITSRGNSLV